MVEHPTARTEWDTSESRFLLGKLGTGEALRELERENSKDAASYSAIEADICQWTRGDSGLVA